MPVDFLILLYACTFYLILYIASQLNQKSNEESNCVGEKKLMKLSPINLIRTCQVDLHGVATCLLISLYCFMPGYEKCFYDVMEQDNCKEVKNSSESMPVGSFILERKIVFVLVGNKLTRPQVCCLCIT